MAFNVNQFRSQLTGDGARPNLFEVSMPFPAFSLPGNAQTKLTFMCKTAQLPGATLGVVPMQYFGRELKFVGNRTFADWSIKVSLALIALLPFRFLVTQLQKAKL